MRNFSDNKYKEKMDDLIEKEVTADMKEVNLESPVKVPVPVKMDALVIADPDQVAVVIDSLEASIDKKEKELKLLYTVRDSIKDMNIVSPGKPAGKTPLFENN